MTMAESPYRTAAVVPTETALVEAHEELVQLKKLLDDNRTMCTDGSKKWIVER